MIRIWEQEGEGARVTLRLEGNLAGASIEELEKACARSLARAASVVLDVSGVHFIDRRALASLRELRERGVTFTNCTPFVAEQLKEVGSC